MSIIDMIDKYVNIIDAHGTIILAIIALLAVFFQPFWSWLHRPKLEIRGISIIPDSLDLEVKNVGKSPAINCYVRISLEKEDDDVISAPKEAFISIDNKSTKIYNDYVSWGISPKEPKISIPPGLCDRALLCRYDEESSGSNIVPPEGSTPIEKEKKLFLMFASEKGYSPARIKLRLDVNKDYTGKVYYGADNCKPKTSKFKIHFTKKESEVIPQLDLDR